MRILSIFMGLFALVGVGFAQTKWDLPAAYPANNFHSENLAQFASDVEKYSNGKLKITVHPGASLFKAPEIKRAVQESSAQAGEILMVNYSNEWPVWGLDGVPFLADSYDEAVKLHKAMKPILEKKLNEQGMMLGYVVPWPGQGIYTKKPIQKLADLKGVKWRAYSPQTARIGELVQAHPVTIQASELAQALATGAVESFMSSGVSGVDSKVWENLKYFYDMNAWLPKNAVLINKKAFEALDNDSKNAVIKAAAEAEKRGLETSVKKADESKATLKANGMEVVQPTPALRAEFKTLGETMLKEWLEKAGPEGKTIIDAFQKP